MLSRFAFSAPLITKSYAQNRCSDPLRRPDCTLSRLLFGAPLTLHRRQVGAVLVRRPAGEPVDSDHSTATTVSRHCQQCPRTANSQTWDFFSKFLISVNLSCSTLMSERCPRTFQQCPPSRVLQPTVWSRRAKLPYTELWPFSPALPVTLNRTPTCVQSLSWSYDDRQQLRRDLRPLSGWGDTSRVRWGLSSSYHQCPLTTSIVRVAARTTDRLDGTTASCLFMIRWARWPSVSLHCTIDYLLLAPRLLRVRRRLLWAEVEGP